MAGEQALRTRIEIIYAGTNITRYIADDLLSFAYTDNDHGKADDLSITLKNEHGRWSGEWMPARGDKITATIVQEGRGAKFPLHCGTFTVDQLEASGPPRIAAIKGVSVPPDTSVRRQMKSRAWENVNLSKIAQDVAATAGIALLWLAPHDPVLDRRDQRDESDLKFLQRLCEDEAYAVKCTDEQLVVFSPEVQAGRPAIATIDVGTDDVKAWRLGAQNHDVYAKCSLEYVNAAKGKLQRYTYTDPLIKDGKTKKLIKRAASLAEAERLAKAGLYEANKGEITGSVTLAGDTRMVAGAAIYLTGAGRFDGKYYIATAAHNIGSGYTTELTLSNTREEVGDQPTVFNTPKTATKGARPDGLESILGE